MRSHGQQVGAGFAIDQAETEFKGFAMGMLHTRRNQCQVLVIGIVAHFIVEPVTQLNQVLVGRSDAHQATAGGQQAQRLLPV
ncbi:hypothetical protein D3C79_981810 [compost metagenome]